MSRPRAWCARAAGLGALLALLPIGLARAAAPDGPTPAGPAPARPAPAHVLIVSVAGLTWEDVAAGHAPALASLSRQGSMAGLSIRTVNSPTDLPSAFATLGAGNRATGVPSGDSPALPNAGPLPGGALMVQAFGQVVAANARLHFGAVPGALGTALHHRGIGTGVVGNQDETSAGVPVPMRFGALALADAAGRVDTGDVDQGLNAGTALAEGEDPEAITTATRAALGQAGVVLVELSGTARVGDALGPAGTGSPARATGALRAAAVSRDDATLGRLFGLVDLGRDTVLVVGPAGPSRGGPDQLMVAVLAGVGARSGGWLTSATTRRNGMVTLADVAPTVLHLYGIASPASMTGQPMQVVAARTDLAGRVAQLSNQDRAAVYYGQRIAGFLLVVVLAGIAVFFAGWAELRRGRTGRMARVVGVAGLVVVAVPVACQVQAWVGGQLWAPLPAFGLVAGADLAVVVIALAGPWRRSPAGPVAVAAGASALAIVVDLLTGSHGQLSSLMGYSPIVAGRFYGLSPLSFAVLASYGLVLTGLFAAGPGRRHPGLAVLGAGVALVGLAGAPMLGAKFGAILTLVPAFGLLALLVRGRRLTARLVLALGGAAGVAALAIGGLDALRPARSQTHIGRFVASLLGGGPGSVGDVLARKADANLGIYLKAPIALLVPLCLLFAALVIGRPPSWLAVRLAAVPGLRAGILAALAAGVIAGLVNDSGAAIPGIGLTLGTPAVLAILLRVRAGAAGAGQDVPLPGRTPAPERGGTGG